MSEATTHLAVAAAVAGSCDARNSRQKLSNERGNVLLGQCLEFTRDIAKVGQQFSITIKLGNAFNFDFRYINEMEFPPMMMQKKKQLPSTVKRNQLRMKTFIYKKKASVMETSSTVDADDTQDVTLAHKDDLSASTFKWDQCEFNTKTSRGLKMHISKQHNIPQLDGDDEVVDNEFSDKPAKYEDPVILGMQDNGFSKLEMFDPDETPPTEVVHPKLGLGIYSKVVIHLEDHKKCVEYSFKKGKFLIEIVLK